MGKHIDKIPWDEPDGHATLPVIIGERRARVLTQSMMVAFYVLVGVLVALETLPIVSLLCLLAIPKLVQVWKPFSSPKPSEPPPGFPIGRCGSGPGLRPHPPGRRSARARDADRRHRRRLK